MGKLKDITKMRPMERFRYLSSTIKVCKDCKKEKRLYLFFNKEECKINKSCNACNKKQYHEEVKQIVLNILRKESTWS